MKIQTANSVRLASLIFLLVGLVVFASHRFRPVAVAQTVQGACITPPSVPAVTCLDQTYSQCQALWDGGDISTKFFANITCVELAQQSDTGRCAKIDPYDCFVGSRGQCDVKASAGYTFTKGGTCPATAASTSPTTAPTVTAPLSETFTPEIPIPNLFDKPQTADSTLLANYIRAIYTYFIWVVGIVSVVMVMYGGIKWVAAAGNPSQIKDARDAIDSAIIGVIIGLVSVVLLNIINPRLTQLSLPGVTSVAKKYFDGAAITSICPVSKSSDTYAKCGELLKTGTTKDRNGKEVDSYCTGVVCDDGGAAGFGSKEHICVVTKDETTSYYIPQGCATDISIDTPKGDYENIKSLKVASDAVAFRHSEDCGHAYSQYEIAGSYCDASGTKAEKQSICYMLGNKAIINDGPTSDDTMNSQCATIQP